jgi:hypothetical protein
VNSAVARFDSRFFIHLLKLSAFETDVAPILQGT